MDKLFKLLIKDYENTKEPAVRDRYGKVAGAVGIISNCILCAMKMIIGLIVGSIAIVADAVNNLADAASSVITLVGFKLASMPEDEEHPYGHARIEYIAGMIVSMIIIIVGFELGKSSVQKIIHPEPLEFSWVIVIILLIAIGIKIWQAAFNVAAGKKINSLALMATGADSRNDVISTAAVLVATVVGYLFEIQIDGYVGVLVAAFIMWSGISLTLETISPLLGETPDDELVMEIENIVMGHADEGVLGIHDLIVHNYGPGKIFASVHIEVDSRTDIMKSHDMIDCIEYELNSKLHISATGHMDPIDTQNPLREPVTEIIEKEVRAMSDDGVLNFHDLRFVPGPTHTNVIFDLVLSPECKLDRDEIKQRILAKLKEYNSDLLVVINFDINYVSREVIKRK